MPFNAPTSNLARQTIRSAFQDLERTITPADSRTFSQTTLQHVRKAALDIENQLAAKQSLRNMRRLAPLLNGLEHYAKVADVLCNGTPYLAWIWAPITLILRISCEYVEAFEQIIKGYAKIAESLVRFEILGQVFRKNLDFQQTIAVFYADILQFHKHAYKFVKRSGWKLMFMTSWGRFQRRFDNILEDMNRHGEIIDKEANANNIADAQQMRQEIRAWRQESAEQVDQSEKEQEAKQFKSIISWLKADDYDQLAIFDAISTEGYNHPGTCSWILNNRKIKSWLEAKADHTTLWLQGIPGSGKSVLTAQVVNFMKIDRKFIIHHICSHSYASSTIYDQVLRSLLLQLLRKDGEIVAHIYEDCVLGKKSPATQALEKLLKNSFLNTARQPGHTEYIWIVIDGLDECEIQVQANVVDFMNQLTSKAFSTGGVICKVLISSRSPSIHASRLRGKHIVSLAEEKVFLGAGIKLYASQRLESMQYKIDQLHIETEEVEEIKLEITKKADGMFLYARLVLDYLTKNIFYSGEEMKRAVHELPDELSEFYRKILMQVLAPLDARSAARVECIFGWIAFTKRPLKRMELLSAITFSSGEPDVNNIAPRYILDICGALVQEKQDTTWSFIHVSVKDFLQSPSSSLKITERKALIEHGTASLTCLLSGLDIFSSSSDQSRYTRVLKGFHGLHVYATEYWTTYLLCDEVSINNMDDDISKLVSLAMKLAEKLDTTHFVTSNDDLNKDVAASGASFQILSRYPLLQKHVRIADQARSLLRLEWELYGENDAKLPTKVTAQVSDGISATLVSYQETLRHLLHQPRFPGVTTEELDMFKSQFRTSAYTCRLNSCPRATMGFESGELLREHELSHARRIACKFPNCQYPPFGSVQAYKAHVSKHHNLESKRKAIRKGGDFIDNSRQAMPQEETSLTAVIPLSKVYTDGEPTSSNPKQTEILDQQVGADILSKSLCCHGKRITQSTCSGCDGHGIQNKMHQVGLMIQRFQNKCSDCDGVGTIPHHLESCRNCARKETESTYESLKNRSDLTISTDLSSKKDQQLRSTPPEELQEAVSRMKKATTPVATIRDLRGPQRFWSRINSAFGIDSDASNSFLRSAFENPLPEKDWHRGITLSERFTNVMNILEQTLLEFHRTEWVNAFKLELQSSIQYEMDVSDAACDKTQYDTEINQMLNLRRSGFDPRKYLAQ